MRAAVTVLPEALAQLGDADDWWREHRLDAPDLLLEEWTQAMRLLEEQPIIGHAAALPHHLRLRILLMPQTLKHVWYETSADEREVLVLALWGAVRGEAPLLPRTDR